MAFEPVTLKLSEPVQFGESLTLEELVFKRPPCAGDMRDMPVGTPTFGSMMTVAARVCGVQPKLMDKISTADMLRVCEVIGGFLGSGLATGENS